MPLKVIGGIKGKYFRDFVHTLARAQTPLGPCLKNVTLMDGAKTGLKVRVCVPTVKSAPQNRIQFLFLKSQKHHVTSLFEKGSALIVGYFPYV